MQYLTDGLCITSTWYRLKRKAAVTDWAEQAGRACSTNEIMRHDMGEPLEMQSDVRPMRCSASRRGSPLRQCRDVYGRREIHVPCAPRRGQLDKNAPLSSITTAKTGRSARAKSASTNTLSPR
eukprot:IDg19471t1